LRAYADTSFLVSLYTPDANSASAGAHMKNLPTALLLTPFGELELLNAFELRVFRGELSVTEVEAARAALREDVEEGIYARRPFPEAAFARAKEIARKRTARLGTRTLDILHVGSALVLQADTFYSFDRNQRRLARAEGLKTP
jgi:predicted nucleic acid-binding protein